MNTRITTYALFVLLALDVVVLGLHLAFGGSNVFFNLDEEVNLPTYYSGLKLFLAAAVTIFLVARGFSAYRKKEKPVVIAPWIVLSAAFLYLGFDEITEFHEGVAFTRTPDFLLSLGWFENEVYYWVVMFALPAVAIALYTVRFAWCNLKSYQQARKLIMAGMTLFVGVLAFEFAGGFVVQFSPEVYSAMIILEESLEFIGASLLAGGVISAYVGTSQPAVSQPTTHEA